VEATTCVGETDANGYYETEFTMGLEDTFVKADAGYLAATSAGTLDFTTVPWQEVGSYEALHLQIEPGAGGRDAERAADAVFDL
jgi:hypothetical protein